MANKNNRTQSDDFALKIAQAVAAGVSVNFKQGVNGELLMTAAGCNQSAQMSMLIKDCQSGLKGAFSTLIINLLS